MAIYPGSEHSTDSKLVVPKARGVKRRGRDRDRAAQKTLEEMKDRQTIYPLYDDYKKTHNERYKYRMPVGSV